MYDYSTYKPRNVTLLDLVNDNMLLGVLCGAIYYTAQKMKKKIERCFHQGGAIVAFYHHMFFINSQDAR